MTLSRPVFRPPFKRPRTWLLVVAIWLPKLQAFRQEKGEGLMSARSSFLPVPFVRKQKLSQKQFPHTSSYVSLVRTELHGYCWLQRRPGKQIICLCVCVLFAFCSFDSGKQTREGDWEWLLGPRAPLQECKDTGHHAVIVPPRGSRTGPHRLAAYSLKPILCSLQCASHLQWVAVLTLPGLRTPLYYLKIEKPWRAFIYLSLSIFTILKWRHVKNFY